MRVCGNHRYAIYPWNLPRMSPKVMDKHPCKTLMLSFLVRSALAKRCGRQRSFLENFGQAAPSCKLLLLEPKTHTVVRGLGEHLACFFLCLCVFLPPSSLFPPFCSSCLPFFSLPPSVFFLFFFLFIHSTNIHWESTPYQEPC